ncbi:hypothetical protein [Pendulispora albinea]|uniref:Uncharacterized protein n=1 Tax=Pendulispora albinea TaxID=2741071 RepID=A0ABZ2M944_9BACT
MTLSAPPSSRSSKPSLSGGTESTTNVRALSLLWFIPFAGALLVVATGIAVPSPTVLMVFRVEVSFVEAVAFIGSALAARAFDRGDYLRTAWALQAACFFFLFFSDLTRFPAVGQIDPTGTLRTVLSMIANGSAIVGAWRFGRAWGEADLPDAARTRRRAYIAAAVVALALAGGPLVKDVGCVLASGDREALTNICSELGDIGSLCLLAPVLPTAIALRGGKLAWPWSLLAASLIAWLSFDGAVAIADGANGDDVTKRTLVEVFRTLGSLFTWSAGIAQRHVMRMGKD